MAIAGIELKYLTNRIAQDTKEYYVSNIYGIDRNSILFKLHHPERPDIFLVISTMGMWITNMRVQQIEENRLVRRLRDNLLRLRLSNVEQPGLERLAYITFEGFDKKFILVGEFFGDGNIILCSESMKVLALQHSIDVRHRSIRVGLEYQQPPQPATDMLHMEFQNMAELLDADMTCSRWVGRNMGLPRRYAEGILHMAGINPKTPGKHLDAAQATAIYDTAKKLSSDIIQGNHTPVTIPGDTPEVIPVDMGNMQDTTPAKDFMSGLDAAFTNAIMERGRSTSTDQTRSQASTLQNRLAEQEKAIKTVQERSARITSVAKSLYTILASGTTRLDTTQAQAILEQSGASIVMVKGKPVMRIMDEDIKIDLEAPLQSTASILYVEAKKQSAAIPSIQKMIEKTYRMLEKAANKQHVQESSVEATNLRKRNWFERYRWFYASGGTLAIGGRDAPSNSAVVRKRMDDSDKVFHAQMFGSPFFILKSATPSDAEVLETAQATVCFSRAWREGLFAASAYWVDPKQVKKSAPSGQYLPKGSFTIEGQRNFVKTSTMRLALGFVEHEGEYLLMCGPAESVAKRASPYITIEPTGMDMINVAKKIRAEFIRMEVPGAANHTIDDFVRVMPAGKSRITGVHHG